MRFQSERETYQQYPARQLPFLEGQGGLCPAVGVRIQSEFKRSTYCLLDPPHILPLPFRCFRLRLLPILDKRICIGEQQQDSFHWLRYEREEIRVEREEILE